MRSVDYDEDVLAPGRRRRPVPEMPAERGLVVETAKDGFCGAVVSADNDAVELADRHGARRVFRMRPAAFLHEGRPVTLVPPRPAEPERAARSASGSVRVEGLRARQARASRIWVEGVHDAELLERVWGHDLRVEGIVVEPLHGLDHVAEAVADFGPGPARRLGVLVDHLVEGSKESRLVERIGSPHVTVTGHPFVDVWAAVRPEAVGITAWPEVPRGLEWKQGVCDALGWGGVEDGWRRVLASVSSHRDLATPLISAVEQLVDFVADPGEA
ncbi:DUF3097 domain-containing protein [Salinifilum aidingensis]